MFNLIAFCSPIMTQTKSHYPRMKEKIDGLKSTLTKNVDELNGFYSDGVVDGFTEQLLDILR